MFCPKCGNEANEEVKFCRKCGANLQGVQEAMTGRGGNKSIDWDKTWVKEMLLSQEERERRQGITPEVKRMNEIKGGVITTAAGLGAMIFLYFFLGAVAANEGKDAVIVGRVWLAGLIPFLVGLALIFNGLFVSKRIVKLKQAQLAQEQEARAQTLTAHTTNQLPEVETPYTSPYSVTERTTYHLPQPPNREMQ
jgi:hypothetical protein